MMGVDDRLGTAGEASACAGTVLAPGQVKEYRYCVIRWSTTTTLPWLP
jgi:hypothetical protein